MRDFIITLDGYHYEIDHITGVIKHLDNKPFKYDKKYSATYDKPEYKKNSDMLQAMRYGFVAASFSRPIKSILDVGYGNGAFLKYCQSDIKHTYGYDVTGVNISGVCHCPDMTPGEVITFWDVLEHFEDHSFLKDLPQKLLCLSLPYCHYRKIGFNNAGFNWFNYWHHRKPNEHLIHFDEESLESFMKYYGWKMIALSFHEDIVRKGKDSPNIMSAAFRRA